MKCPNCHRQNAPDAKICDQCGHLLDLPPEVDRSSVTEVSLHASPEETNLEKPSKTGERRSVTILFADVVGSTAIAEKRDPEEAKVIMEGCLNLMIAQVHRFEGYVADLLGDGLMAYFGAPVTHEDDPERAVRAALGIQESVLTYADEIEASYDVKLQLRVGLNTGEVVVGEIGRDQKIEYVAVGDAVNLASRMESNAPIGGILISGNTHQLVERIFDFEPQGEIVVKGREEPVGAFLVTGLAKEPGRSRGIEGLYSPIIGREREQAQLLDLIKKVKNGSGQFLVVMGEAGIGKSRLVEEIREETLDEDFLWLEGRAVSYRKNSSLWVFQDLIRNFLDLSDKDSASIVQIKLKSKIRKLYGDRAVEFYPYLASLLNLKLEEEVAERVSHLHPEAMKRRIFVVVGKLIERLAEEHPLVIVFEDLHWGDPSSVDLIQALLPMVNRLPVLLWMVARPYKDQYWWRAKVEAQIEYAQNYIELSLEPLKEQAASSLVDSLLKIDSCPLEIKTSLLEKTGGNPFFLEEAIRVLIDRGVLIRKNGNWVTKEKNLSIHIPETVQGVLRARIDMLEDGPKNLLQIGAVIGKSFLQSVLEHVSGETWELTTHLQALQKAELIIDEGRFPEPVFSFKHDLTQEVAYYGLLETRRKTLHHKVGESIETLYPERLEEFYSLLGHHWCEAGVTDKATGYLIKAGDRARLAYSISEAEKHYGQALDLLASEDNEAELGKTWMKLGYVHHLAGRYERMNSAYEKAFEIWDRAHVSETHQEGERLTWLISMGLAEDGRVTLDPGLADDPISTSILDPLFEGLVRLDSGGNIVPAAAKRWEILDEGTRYIFHLHPHLEWSDGSPVTAKDFEFAWKRNLDPSTGSRLASVLHVIQGAREFNLGQGASVDDIGVRALNDTTLEVRLVGPVPYFLFILTLEIAVPLPGWKIETYQDRWIELENYVTNGSFTLTDYQRGTRTTLKRNPTYRGVLSGNVSSIEFRLAQSDEEVIPLYKTREYDLAWIPPASPVDETEFGDEFRNYPGLGTMFFAFNTSTPPFDNLLVRRAFAHAMNRTELERSIKRPVAHGGIIPPSLAGHSPEIGLPYDIEYAKGLLSEAGVPQGKTLPPIRLGTINELKNVTETVAVDWQRDLGLHVELQTFPSPSAYLDVPQTDRPAIMGFGWSADYPDADNFMRVLFLSSSPYNLTGWKSEEYDSLVNGAIRIANQSDRMKTYQNADEILVVEQTLVIPIYYMSWNFLVKPWVRNLNINTVLRSDMREVIVDRG